MLLDPHHIQSHLVGFDNSVLILVVALRVVGLEVFLIYIKSVS